MINSDVTHHRCDPEQVDADNVLSHGFLLAARQELVATRSADHVVDVPDMIEAPSSASMASRTSA